MKKNVISMLMLLFSLSMHVDRLQAAEKKHQQYQYSQERQQFHAQAAQDRFVYVIPKLCVTN